MSDRKRRTPEDQEFKTEIIDLEKYKYGIKEKNYEKLTISGIEILFPFKPYPSQLMLMSKFIPAMMNGKNALLESPTGTGKTLTILSSALAFLEYEKQQYKREPRIIKPEKKPEPILMDLDPDFIEPLKKHVEIAFEKEAPSYQVPFKQTKIYVASRTQKQIDQMVKELREKSPYRPKMSIMGSRDHYCINSKVSKADDKNDACDDAVSNGSCFYHKGFQKIVDAEEFKAQGSSCVWDIEDLKAAGKKKRGCPYFASRDMAARADIVFLPYNYLIDPFIREACDIVLDDAIVIIDEAHNIESVATDAASVQIDERILDESLRRLKAEVNEITFEHYQKLAVPVAGIKRWLDNTCAGEEGFVDQGTISRSKILTGMDAISAFKEFGLTMDVHSTLLNSLKQVTPKGGDQEKTEIEFLPKRVCNFLNSILYILKTFSSGHWKEYRVIMTQYTADEDNGRNGYNAGEKLIHFHCMNPAVAFEDLTQKTKSIILTSGTLSPLASFSSELGVDFAYTVEAPHAVERDQIWIGAVPKSPSGRVMKGIYTEFNRFEYQDELGESILRICSVIPDGILVFLPSYSLLSNLERRWTQTKLIRKMGVMKDIYIEPRTNAKGAFDNLLVDFGESISSGKGGIIFCIYRGKMSEGIDFKDERARAVVCVGIPYPNIKDIRVQQKKEYNNMFSKSKGLVNGNAWVEIQAFRALNQALGRCIRHKSDWGAMIFLESRFCDSNHTISNLPKWTRASTKQYQDFQSAERTLRDFVAHCTNKCQSQESVEKKPKIIPVLQDPPSPEVTIIDDVKTPSRVSIAKQLHPTPTPATKAKSMMETFFKKNTTPEIIKRQQLTARCRECGSDFGTKIEKMERQSLIFPTKHLSENYEIYKSTTKGSLVTDAEDQVMNAHYSHEDMATYQFLNCHGCGIAVGLHVVQAENSHLEGSLLLSDGVALY